jgi:hypothetical protein
MALPSISDRPHACRREPVGGIRFRCGHGRCGRCGRSHPAVFWRGMARGGGADSSSSPSHVSAATRRLAKDFEAASIPSAEAWVLSPACGCVLGSSQDPDMPNTYFGSGSQNEGQVGGLRFRIATKPMIWPHGDERKLNFPFWCHSSHGR